MSWFTKAFSGSIGQKLIMALTGLFLVTFLIEHLLSNLMLLKDDGTDYNNFAEFMGSNPIIKAAEYVLFAGFIFHIVYAAIITAQNKKARPIGYAVSNAGENSSWFSRNMGLSGSIVFIFLVVHLKTFFINYKVLGNYTTEAPTLYDGAVLAFKNPIYVVLYVVAMVLLAFHLNHGFASAFQTLGLRHTKYTPFIKGLGTAFSIVVPAMFAFIPVYMYFAHQ